MDWTYSTVPLSKYTMVKFHSEKEKKHHVEDSKKHSNEYIYHTYNIGNYSCYSTFLAPVEEKFKDEKVEEIWKMNFDGTHLRFGKGDGIVITSPRGQVFNFAFRLEFEATNNVSEYEALLLGLEIAKELGFKMLNIRVESDLIIHQIQNHFSCKCKRLKKHRNVVWDTMGFFDALNLTSIHRDQNSLANKLAVAYSTLQP